MRTACGRDDDRPRATTRQAFDGEMKITPFLGISICFAFRSLLPEINARKEDRFLEDFAYLYIFFSESFGGSEFYSYLCLVQFYCTDIFICSSRLELEPRKSERAMIPPERLALHSAGFTIGGIGKFQT